MIRRNFITAFAALLAAPFSLFAKRPSPGNPIGPDTIIPWKNCTGTYHEDGTATLDEPHNHDEYEAACNRGDAIQNGQIWHQLDFPCFEVVVLMAGPVNGTTMWCKAGIGHNAPPLITTGKDWKWLYTEVELLALLKARKYTMVSREARITTATEQEELFEKAAGPWRIVEQYGGEVVRLERENDNGTMIMEFAGGHSGTHKTILTFRMVPACERPVDERRIVAMKGGAFDEDHGAYQLSTIVRDQRVKVKNYELGRALRGLKSAQFVYDEAEKSLRTAVLAAEELHRAVKFDAG